MQSGSSSDQRVTHSTQLPWLHTKVSLSQIQIAADEQHLAWQLCKCEFLWVQVFLDILMQNSLLFISKDFSSIIQFCPELWTLQTKGLNQENNYIELKGCSALCVKVLEILLEDWGSSHCFMNTLCRVYSIQKTCILFLLLAYNAQVHIHRVYLVDVYSQSSTVGEAVSTSSTHIFIPGLTSCCQQAHLLHLGHPHLETHKHILQFT